MKNGNFLKLLVNEQQTLHDIIQALEDKGYKRKYELNIDSTLVCVFDDGIYVDFIDNKTDNTFKEITINELIEFEYGK